MGDDSPGVPVYVYGRESSATSAGTVRADLGLQYEFGGPARSRMRLGLSVINLGFGPVAPEVAAEPFIRDDVVAVRYERLYDMPAVPTLTLGVEF